MKKVRLRSPDFILLCSPRLTSWCGDRYVHVHFLLLGLARQEAAVVQRTRDYRGNYDQGHCPNKITPRAVFFRHLKFPPSYKKDLLLLLVKTYAT